MNLVWGADNCRLWLVYSGEPAMSCEELSLERKYRQVKKNRNQFSARYTHCKITPARNSISSSELLQIVVIHALNTERGIWCGRKFGSVIHKRKIKNYFRRRNNFHSQLWELLLWSHRNIGVFSGPQVWFQFSGRNNLMCLNSNLWQSFSGRIAKLSKPEFLQF